MHSIITASYGGQILALSPPLESLGQPWAAQLGWTLLHSLWQLAAVAVVYGLTDRLLARQPSQSRYLAAVMALALMALLPAATWSRMRIEPLPQSIAVQTPPTASIEVPPTATLDREPLPEAVATASPTELPMTRDMDVTPASLPPAASAAVAITPVMSIQANAPEFVRQWCEPWLGALVSVWLAGVLLASLRPLVGLWTQVRLRRVGLSVVPDAVQGMLDRLAERMGIRRVLRIAGSTLVQAPAVVGYLRPLILLPVSALTGLSPRELEAVLAHELAHVRRHDWLVNALQLAVETLLFFHPAVWWISRRIRQEREHCCDDAALAVMGDRAAYGRLLLTMEHLRQRLPAPSLGADGGSLVQRIRRLAGRESQPLRGWEDWSIATLLLLMGIVGFLGASTSRAEPPAKESAAAEPTIEKRIEPDAVPSTRETAASTQDAARTESSRAQTETDQPKLNQPGESKPDVNAAAKIDLPPDWFRLDPYPGLGHSDDLGEGWRYLRLASDNGARLELGLSQEQHRLLSELNAETTKRQAAVRGADVVKQRVIVWNEAQAVARKLVDEAQDRRIRQIALQRRSYRALQDPVVQDALALTADQKLQVEQAIKAHLTRVAELDAGLKRTKVNFEEEERVGERNTQGLISQARVERNAKGIASHKQVWTDVFLLLTGAQRLKLEEMRGPPVIDAGRPSSLAWQRTDKYVPPDFANFFPDDAAGGKRLDDLYESRTQQALSDQDILETVRRGLKRTKQHQTLVLAWIGNQYIWGQAQQNAKAIEIMYHASASPDRGNTAHYAIYFGLSVVQDKTPNLLRAMAEAAVDSIHDTRSRIVWGLGPRYVPAFTKVLEERLDSGELTDRQKIAMYDLYLEVAGKAPPRPERFAALGLFQFEYVPKPGITLTAEELTARFIREIDPLEEAIQHGTRHERGKLVGESRVRSITVRDDWLARFKKSDSLQLGPKPVQIIDEPIRISVPAQGPIPLALDFATFPTEGDISCQNVLRWLPTDTDTMVVASHSTLKLPSLKPDPDVSVNLPDIAGYVLLSHGHFDEPSDVRLQLLQEHAPKFIVKGGRQFRFLGPLGAMAYDGAIITGFKTPLPEKGQQLFDMLYLLQGAKPATLNGFPAVWVPKPAKGSEPAHHHWYVLPRPDLLIDGTSESYIKDLLTRMQSTPADRAFPSDDPLWKHVDQQADVFMVRRLGTLPHVEKRLEPRKLIGLTLSAKVGPGGYLRGMLVPGPGTSPVKILGEYFNTGGTQQRRDLATHFLGRAKEDHVEFILEPLNPKSPVTQSALIAIAGLQMLE